MVCIQLRYRILERGGRGLLSLGPTNERRGCESGEYAESLVGLRALADAVVVAFQS
jgi:hypothetical protein